MLVTSLGVPPNTFEAPNIPLYLPWDPPISRLGSLYFSLDHYTLTTSLHKDSLMDCQSAKSQKEGQEDQGEAL